MQNSGKPLLTYEWIRVCVCVCVVPSRNLSYRPRTTISIPILGISGAYFGCGSTNMKSYLNIAIQ